MSASGPRSPREPAPPALTTEDELLLRAVARLNARVLGAVTGLVAGIGLLLATLVLVLKDGPAPGPHLVLLSQYFPGYSVSVAGAFLGFVYAFLAGYLAGYAVGKVYNRIVRLRNARS